MQLSNKHRAEIVESVVKTGTFIEAEKEAITKSTSAAVREACRVLLPEGFEAATAIMPIEWLPGKDSHDVAREANPIYLLKNKEQRDKSYSYPSIQFDKLSVPSNFKNNSLRDHFKNNHSEKYIGSARHPDRATWEEILSAQIDAAKKLRAKEDALRDELMGFLMSCRTSQQVLAKMPDLERHMPAAPVRAYPVQVSVTALVGQLGKLGFDRGAPTEMEAV